MPKRDVQVISHSALTNHRIPASPSEPFNTPEANSKDLVLVNSMPGKAELPLLTQLRAYGEVATRDPTYQQRYTEILNILSTKQPEEPYVQAALGHRAFGEGKDEEALSHFVRAKSLNDSTVVSEQAAALTSLGKVEEAVSLLEAGVESDPYHAVLRKTLILDYIKLKKYPAAKAQMEKYVELFPQDDFMRSLLARVSH